LPNSHLLHFYITVTRPVLEYCAQVWHYTLTKAQSESLQAVEKHAIHITHNLTRGMPYSSMYFHTNLDLLTVRREDLSQHFLRNITDPLHSHFPPPKSTPSPEGSDLLKSFLKSILVPSAIVLSAAV